MFLNKRSVRNAALQLGAMGLLAATSGCGDDTPASTAEGLQSQPQPTASATVLPAEQLTESYRFRQNGCDTGQQEVTADTPDELRQRLCSALQDDALNKSCAERARYEYFQQKCPGQTWKALYASGSPVSANAFLKFSGVYWVQSYFCQWDGVPVVSPVRQIEVRQADPSVGSAVIIRSWPAGSYATFLNTFEQPNTAGGVHKQEIQNEPGRAVRAYTLSAPGVNGFVQTMTDTLDEDDNGFTFSESDVMARTYPWSSYHHGCQFKLTKVR
jgi:hypothetical protein